MSLLAQALTDSRIVMDSTHFLPHEEHFWPDTPDIGPRLPITRTGGFSHGKMSTGMAKVDNCLLLVEPKIQPLISGAEMDSFEYILRNLFVLKRHSVSSALKHMAPGADNILKMLHSGHPVMETMGPIEIDPETIVMDLTVEQFVCLAKLFDRWPFRPVHLFEVRGDRRPAAPPLLTLSVSHDRMADCWWEVAVETQSCKLSSFQVGLYTWQSTADFYGVIDLTASS